MHESVKSVCIWSFYGSYFPAFGLNTERYGVSLRIQSKCVKIRTRKTVDTDTFYAVIASIKNYLWPFWNFTMSTFITSPNFLKKTFKTIHSTLNGFKFNLFVTLWLHAAFVDRYQKVCAHFYFNHFKSKLYQHWLFAKNCFYIICIDNRCMIIILMKVLILTVLTILTFITAFMIFFRLYCTNRNIVTTFTFFATVIWVKLWSNVRLIKTYVT